MTAHLAPPGYQPYALDMVISKISLLRSAAAKGDWRAALRIASRFPQLGDDRAVILAGWEAIARPGFQRQLGRDPEALLGEAVAALKRRYCL